MKLHTTLLRAIVVTLLAFVVGCSIGDATTSPECPTEDSCTIDYRNGAWHITPDAP